MFHVMTLVRSQSRPTPGLEHATRLPAMLVGALLAATLVAAPTRGQNPLVAHYTFDDPANTYTTGGTIRDVSGNGFNGTVVNAALTPNATGGVSGSSINAVSSGTASFTTSYAANPVTADNFTLMFWVKAGAPDSYLDFGQINYSNGTSGQLRTTSAGDATPRTFYYRHAVTSNSSFQFGQSGGAVMVDSTGSGLVWKQVAFMADSTTGQYGYYVDGGTPRFQGLPTTNNPFTSATTVTGLRMGRSDQNNSRTGQIDEVQLYRRSLTQTEVQLLFANPGYGGTTFRAWDPAAASNSWTAAANDWQGLGSAAAPGVTGDAASTNADVAILKNYAFSASSGLGIDMSGSGANGSLALGGISFNSASGPLRIGNSAADTSGTLRLNGGLVDSVANTILKVAGSSDLTIGNSASGSGAQTMGVELTGATNLIDVAASRTLTIESAISQSGPGSAIRKTGDGTLMLSATNAYGGGTTISAGVVEFASGGLGSSGTVSVSGGTLRWAAGSSQDVSNRLAPLDALASFDTNGNTVTLASAVGGSSAGGLRKAGTGTLVLGATNTYAGRIFIDAGTLEIADVGMLGTGTGNAGRINFTGPGTLRYTGVTPGTIANRELFSDVDNSSMTIDVSNATGSLTITPTGGTRRRPFTKTGPGTLTMNGGFVDGANGNAPITANGGTLILGADNSNTGATTIAAGATLQVGVGGSAGALGSGPIINAGTLIVNRSDSVTMTQAMSSTGSVVKAGSGTMMLSGTGSSGGVAVQGGVLAVASDVAVGSGPITLSGGSLRLGAAAGLTVPITLAAAAASTRIDLGGIDSLEYLVAGGGGGGGGSVSGVAYPAGGGGGQVLAGEGLRPTAMSIAVTVGSGGSFGNTAVGSAGGSSALLTVTAVGGRGGGTTGAGIGGASGSGNAGGANNGTSSAGGGGGQTAVGQQGTTGSGTARRGGHGGAGLTSTIAGGGLMYGFGGGGGTVTSGGLSLNGDGTSTDPRVNSGGGGRATSGSSTTTGVGAAGVVIVRYAGEPAATGGTIDTTSVPGYTIHTFNSSDTLQFFAASSRTLSGPIGGSGGFTLDSVGALTLSASNTYQGGTIVSAGTLVAGSSAALGSGAVTVNARGRLRLDQGSVIANQITNLGSGSLAGSLDFAGGGLARTSTAGGGTLGSLLAGSAATPTVLNPAISWSAAIPGTTIADVMTLTNTAGTAQVLSLSYDPAAVTGLLEQDTFLGWLDTQSSTWVNAVAGNTGGTAGYFSGSWADYLLANPGATPATALGTYGHDATTDTVWAVVNHNSDYSVIVVPEPSTLALTGLGLATAAAGMRHRRRGK